MKPKAPIRITSNTNSTTMVKDIAAKLIDACGSDLSESQVASLYALVEDLFRGVSVFSLGATKIRRYPGFPFNKCRVVASQTGVAAVI